MCKIKQIFQSYDNFVISHPKSGRTWLRVAMGKILFDRYGYKRKDIMTNNAYGIKNFPYFHHDHFHTLKDEKDLFVSFYKDKKVILLIRDPRDTIVSYFFQIIYRKGPFDTFQGNSISDFIRCNKYGILNLIDFYNFWHENKNVPKDVLIIKYEDMHKNLGKVLKKVFVFFDFKNPSAKEIQDAVKYSSFKSMRKKEEQGYFHGEKLSKLTLSEDVRDKKNALKTRDGKIGGYKKYLSVEDIVFVENCIRENSCPFYQI